MTFLKDDWWQNWLIPTIDNIDIQTVSWEDIVAKIKEPDLALGQALNNFYNLCLQFNRPEGKKL